MTRADARARLHGRDEELRQLADLLERAQRGSGRTIVLSGPAGIGKTALLDGAAELGSSVGCRVVRGRAPSVERSRPFALFDALLPEHASDEQDRRRDAIIDDLADRIEAAALERPLLLILDDVHRADPSSVLLVDRLVREAPSIALAVILGRRPSPRHADLDRIEERPEVETIDLPPLDPGALRAIVEDALGRAPEADLVTSLGRVEGSPLLALLAAEAFGRRPAGGAVERRDDVIGMRLGEVSTRSSDVLRAASVIGQRFDLDELALVTRTDRLGLMEGLREAIDAGLLREDGPELAFRHEVIWQAVYDAVPEPVRAALHRDLAHRLAEMDGPSERIAQHLSAGGLIGQAGDVELLAASADRLAASDPTTAAGLYDRALAACPDDDPRRSLLASAVVNTLVWSGRFFEARTRAQALLAAPLPPTARADIRRSLARVLAYQGRVEASLAVVEEGLSDDDVPDVQRGRLLADASLRRLVCGDPAGARQAGETALELATASADPVGATIARCALSRCTAEDGDVEAAVALARQAVPERGSEAQEAIELLQPHLYLGLAALDADRFADARHAFRFGRETAERLGATWIVPLFHLGHALVALVTGDADEATAEAETSVAAADELGIRVFVPWAHAILLIVADMRGQDPSRHLDAIERQERADGPCRYGDAWVTWAAMRRLEASGRPDEAARRGWADWHAVPARSMGGERRLYAVDLVRLLVAQERAADAEAIVRGLDGVARRAGTIGEGARAALAAGIVRGDADAVRAAAADLETVGRRLEAVRAMEDAAAAFAATGDSATAVDIARQAARSWEGMGASFDLARTEALLRSLGIRRGVRRARRKATVGWDSVTDTERRVLELLAEGLTNRAIAERMFISPRTVETHVSHLFGKLDATSRLELASRYADERRANP